MVNAIKTILFMMAIPVLSGCGTTCHIVPAVAEVEDVNFCLVGHIQYSGNTDYLPQTIKQGKESEDLPDIIYTYNVGYGKDAIPEVLPLFNPLSLVGFPIGSDSVVIIGVLEITKNGKSLKKYESTCVFDKTRNLFYEGDTFSELRKKGLQVVRENIEVQMLNEREILSNLLQ